MTTHRQRLARRDIMNQDERLDYLVEKFKEDSGQYRDLEVADDRDEKRRILRSLMNIRMPRPMDPEVLRVQDEYLKERLKEMGVVDASDLPTIAQQGSTYPYGDRLVIWQGDITLLKCGVIVNAANSAMLGCFIPMHACIDNCIQTYAGIQMRAECHRQMEQLRKQYGNDYEQPTAVPMFTDGYNLPAENVIHIVGPIVDGPVSEEDDRMLAQCYSAVLDMCAEHEMTSVAFCCISTGVFHFPNRRAAKIAVQAVTDWMDDHPRKMDRVIFNVFKDEDKAYYEKELF